MTKLIKHILIILNNFLSNYFRDLFDIRNSFKNYIIIKRIFVGLDLYFNCKKETVNLLHYCCILRC